jgi:hypothetical protein
MAFYLKFLESMKIHFMFHIYLLQPYHASPIRRKIHESLPPLKINGELKCEVKN